MTNKSPVLASKLLLKNTPLSIII